jgi:hypothetical protein
MHAPKVKSILLTAAIGLLAASSLAGDAKGKPSLSESVRRQLKLKRQLGAITKGYGKLADMIAHNRRSWNQLTPDQQSRFRKHALAFLQADEAEQQQLLRHYEKLIRMTAQKRREYRNRARWLKKVVAELSQQQRQSLREMTPRERAEALLQWRDEFVQQGRIQLDGAQRQDRPQGQD